MRDLKDILEEVNARIAAAAAKSGRTAADVEIVAVTKTHGPDVVREAWEAGLRIVGENKVQEAAWKRPLAVSGPDWHLIGHLQKNKVRPALELFSCLHSVDSVSLIERLQRVAEEIGARPSILLEVNMSGERSKSGMRPEDAPAAVEETRPVFAGLRELRDAMEVEFGARFPRLSMGMSGDYEVAVEEGATWVRLGTVLFGERPKARPERAVDAGDAGESGEGGGAYDRVLD